MSTGNQQLSIFSKQERASFFPPPVQGEEITSISPLHSAAEEYHRYLAHAPGADLEKHQGVFETSKYKLFVIIVKNQHEAFETCKKLFSEDGIHAILLCPGFTHGDVAKISETVGDNVGVFIARGDGPSTKVQWK